MFSSNQVLIECEELLTLTNLNVYIFAGLKISPFRENFSEKRLFHDYQFFIFKVYLISSFYFNLSAGR